MKRSLSGASNLSLLLEDYEVDLILSHSQHSQQQLGAEAKGHFHACESLCDSFFDPNVALHSLEGMQYEGPLLSGQSGGTSSYPTSSGDEPYRELSGNAIHLASENSAGNIECVGPILFDISQGSPNGHLLAHYGNPGSPPSSSSHVTEAKTLSLENTLPSSSPQSRVPGKRGRGRTSHANPSASTLAQRRYHERQKAKKADENRKMEELRHKMEQLMSENRLLVSKQQMLVKDMLTWQSHVETLWNQEAVRKTSQNATLKLTADIIGRVTGQTFTLQEAKQWTLQQFVYNYYQKFIDRENELCDLVTHSQYPREQDVRELEILWDLQKAIEIRGGLGSSIHLTMWAFNVRETERRQNELPNSYFWERILDGMRLSNEQTEKILSSYEWMHNAIVKTMQERERDILPKLYKEAEFIPREKMHFCPAASRLYRSLRTEQTTVLGFMMQVEKVLTKVQRAYFECKSYPWNGDWMEVCKLIMARKGRLPLAFPDVSSQGYGLDIFPKATAFQAFTTTITALGIGSRLKPGTCICPFETVMSRLCFPNPPLERMGKVKLLDAMTGSWRTYTCWQWMQKVKELGVLITNDLIEDGNGVKEEPDIWLEAHSSDSFNFAN